MTAPGLTQAEAHRLLAAQGPNEVERRGRASVLGGVGAQLRDPLVMVLLVACALTVVTGDLADAAVIALVVVVNTTVGVAQEIRADRAVTALAQLSAPAARVRRDGVEGRVPSAELVPGDVVLLGEGDVVPADAELVEASGLLVDESALTGESVAVGKAPTSDEGRRLSRPPPSDHRLSAGTVVVRGRAEARVTATGADSALGTIAALLDERPQPTPLQLRLAELGRLLAEVAVALCLVVLVLGLARGEPLELMVVTAISLAVAAVPESLPAVVTLSLALGAARMAARDAVVRRLPAVETLGSVTVLATDKTGTLTQAQMVVREVWTPRHALVLSGEGYDPVGELVARGHALDAADAPDVVELLSCAALCNDARLLRPERDQDPWSGLGDPTEVALLAAAGKVGRTREELERRHPRVAELPFESATRRMTTVHLVDPDRADGPRLVLSKGSPEALLARHGAGHHGAGRHGLAWAEAAHEAARLADRGFRVLAVAAGRSEHLAGADETVGEDVAASDQGLELLGLLALDDPAKPAAAATIAACRAAGMTPVLVTGDHPSTARAVAEQVGILAPGTVPGTDAVSAVVTGADIEAGRVPDLTRPRVFARTSPAQKLDIVQAWRDRGAVVAMTGDGVNDGPALRRADIGVAMGHRGTEVARQAADLVLADDELATVVVAVEEGRRVYANIRRFLLFALAGGTAEILVMLAGPFMGLAVPLLPAQILWVNLLTHGLTGVALGAEPVEPGAMQRPPRPPEQSVLGAGLWQRVLRLGLLIALVTLLVGVWGHGTDRAWQTMVFLALTSLQLGVALGLRARLLESENAFLPLAVAGSLVLALAGVYVPALQDLLGTVALPWADTAVALACGTLGLAAARADRLLGIRAPAAAGHRA